jgi:hypothetical protein
VERLALRPPVTPTPHYERGTTGQPVDVVYGTAVLSTNRLLALFYWGRSAGSRKPLILLDFDVSPLTRESWGGASLVLASLLSDRRVHSGAHLGLWVEGESLAARAGAVVPDCRPIPVHLTRPEAWHPICQSAASILAEGLVGYTQEAADAMDKRPFLTAAGVYAGPRTEDPTIAAFLYGVVLGLDPILAEDPHPKPRKKMSRV